MEGPETATVALMLHGFPQFADSWLPVMNEVASAGFRAVAVNQRGYSSGARPFDRDEYDIEKLVSGTWEDSRMHWALASFYILGHDWGAYVAWVYASRCPQRIRSLTSLCTPHPNALLHAMQNDADQKQRSQYISLFRMPTGAAENYFCPQTTMLLYVASIRARSPNNPVNENIKRFKARPCANSRSELVSGA